jgi:protein tyrosine/serine phosphatase
MRSTIVFFILLLFISGHAMAQEPGKERPADWARKDTIDDLKNLYRLNQDVYRSEQPARKGFECLETAGIESVLNLRKRNADGRRAGDHKITLYHVQMTAGKITNAEVIEVLRLIQSAPKPILIHCAYGSDRTGLVCAMYRIVFQGWTKQEAIGELINGGYGFHRKFKNIPFYIEQSDIEEIEKEINEY